MFREEMALFAPLKNIAVSSFEKNLDKYLQQATCGGVLKRKRNAWTVIVLRATKWIKYKVRGKYVWEHRHLQQKG